MSDHFELLEHTADIGIAAYAASWLGLLRQLVLGWRRIVCSGPIAAQTDLQCTIDGADRAELLVNLLNELCYLLETRNFLPAELQIEEGASDGLTLELRLRGETCDPARHRLLHEVKAATYHQLRIDQDESGWQARVYLDI